MSSLKLRQPAYGKQLLNERRLGNHPLVVHVIYGEEINCGTCCDDCDGGVEPKHVQNAPPSVRAHPHVAVKPSEFKPWTIDWHVLTGCLAAVFDLRPDPLVGSRHFYEMLGEIGRFAGPIHVYRLEPEKPLHGVVVAWRWQFCWQAHRVMAQMKEGLGEWPSFWPIETERVNAERRERWAGLYAARLERARAAA